MKDFMEKMKRKEKPLLVVQQQKIEKKCLKSRCERRHFENAILLFQSFITPTVYEFFLTNLLKN